VREDPRRAPGTAWSRRAGSPPGRSDVTWPCRMRPRAILTSLLRTGDVTVVRGVRLGAVLLAGALVLACAGEEEEPEPIGGGDTVEEPSGDADDGLDDEDGPGDDADDDEIEEFAAPDDPEDIDAAYVDAVLDRMHEGLVPAARDAVAAGEVTDDLRDALADVYTEASLEVQERIWHGRVTGEGDEAEVQQADGNLEARTHDSAPRIVDADCLIVSAEVDERPVFGDDSDPLDYDVALVAADPTPPVNPTPWQINLEGVADADASWCER
jgi:hypothetical protein